MLRFGLCAQRQTPLQVELLMGFGWTFVINHREEKLELTSYHSLHLNSDPEIRNDNLNYWQMVIG